MHWHCEPGREVTTMIRGKIHRTTFCFWRVIVCLFVISVLFVAMAGKGRAAAVKPGTVAELALYKGADRQQILEAGAKKEGKLTFYTTGTQAQHLVKAFEKKYPFIKVEFWRAGTRELIPKIFEEAKLKKTLSDVIGGTDAAGITLREAGLLQPFFSPALNQIEDEALEKAPSGAVYSAGHFQSGRGIGFNTKLIKKDEVPKTYKDLLNPKWKGKMPIVGDWGGVVWMGAVLSTYGEEFVIKLARQDFSVHMISARALNDMIISGEYAFSPTISDDHVDKSKKEGAPVDWLPLEPVAANLGQILLPKDSPHPCAALLFIDFDLSKEGGEIYKAEGYNSPRKDVTKLRTYKTYFGFNSTKEVKQTTDLFDKLFLKK